VTDDLRLTGELPTLRRPILVCAFRGWNDGGQGASLAAGFLTKTWKTQQFAEIDPEEFFDFQVTRPHVSLVDGATRHIQWPETTFGHAEVPGLDRDAVVLEGIEPNFHWRRFGDIIGDLASDLGIELVVTLGSLLADVPHTRPAPVTGSATDQKLIDELGLDRSRYEGPTGIVGVLHDAFFRRGISAVNLWAAVPHYVSLAPSPRAALALCERLGSLLGAPIDTAELEKASEEYAEQVSQAVASDAETAAYVEELEQRSDDLAATDISGETIAAELTRFLRDRERGNGGGPKPPPDDLPREQ
jgi:predicted ATP-grasp superfamily ATP-dependent carboligase